MNRYKGFFYQLLDHTKKIKKINGIPIGVCTSLGSQCCHSLSCSHENLKALNETHSRRKRSIINERLQKAKKELKEKGKFDKIIMNDNLKLASIELLRTVNKFIS